MAGRLQDAFDVARADLLAERVPAGHWEGQLASSALSTATAVSALALVGRHAADPPADGERLIAGGVRWLAERQNPDGGWGDTDRSLSNIATTMLVRAAFHLAGVQSAHADALRRAVAYIERAGGLAGLRKRYGKDKTFAVPILTNCALAGLVPWRQVSPLPFELACFPQSLFRFLRLPVVSYAIPALVAIGQARYFHLKPRNPLARAVRSASVGKSLRVLEAMQPASGGFLEATPLTSFVVMSLAGIGQAEHPVARRGVQFLLDSVRDDGSWPIDTNLATWNTTLSINALAASEGDQAEPAWSNCLDWLLACQHTERHPYTGAAPGGWAWTDLSGGVPDVDDTSGALLALATWPDECAPERRLEAAAAGCGWLLDLQNSDGGWPTFCRGWGTMPFDRSATDLAAHAMRALRAWEAVLKEHGAAGAKLAARIPRAVERGFAFLARTQQADGSWFPLWFGHQFHADEENPVYGTARVLAAYRDFGRLETPQARRGFIWLAENQNEDGGWGAAGLPPVDSTGTGGQASRGTREAGGGTRTKPTAEGVNPLRAGDLPPSSVEETALAVEALLSGSAEANVQRAASRGLDWLIRAVEAKRHGESSPIGFYFAKLWYYEKLYPLIFTASALGRALGQGHPGTTSPASQARSQPPHPLNV